MSIRETNESPEPAPRSNWLPWVLMVLTAIVIVAGASVLSDRLLREDDPMVPAPRVDTSMDPVAIDDPIPIYDPEPFIEPIPAVEPLPVAPPDEVLPSNPLGLPTQPLLPDGATPLDRIPVELPSWPSAEMTMGYETRGDGLVQQNAVFSILDADAAKVLRFFEVGLVDRGFSRTESPEPDSPYLVFTGNDRYIMIRAWQAENRAMLAAFVTRADDAVEGGQP